MTDSYLNNKTLGFFFFVSSFFPYLIAKYFALDDTNEILFYIFIFSFICLMFKLFFQFYTKKEIIIFLSLLVFLSIIVLKSENYSLILSLLVLLSLKNISINRFIYSIFAVGFIIFGSHIILSKISIIDSYTYSVVRFNGTNWVETIRDGLGYKESNIAGVLFFNLVCLYALIKRRIYLIDIIFLLLANVFIYSNLNSRTSFLCVLFFLGLIFLVKYFNIFKYSFMGFFVRNSYLLFFLIQLSLSYFYDRNIFFINKINSLLTNRISLGNIFLNEYNIPILGQKIAHTSGSINTPYMVLDIFFLDMLLSLGLIFTILFLYYSKKIIVIMLDNKLYIEVAVFCSFGFYGISETFLGNIYINISLIFFVFILYPNKLNEYITAKYPHRKVNIVKNYK